MFKWHRENGSEKEKNRHNVETQKSSWLNKRYHIATHQNSYDKKNKNPNQKEIQELGTTSSAETAVTEWRLTVVFLFQDSSGPAHWLQTTFPRLLLLHKNGGKEPPPPVIPPSSSRVTPKFPSIFFLPRWQHNTTQVLASYSQVRACTAIFCASQEPQMPRWWRKKNQVISSLMFTDCKTSWDYYFRIFPTQYNEKEKKIKAITRLTSSIKNAVWD